MNKNFYSAKGKPIPLEELAKGHSMAVGNAYRLIEDGEVLIQSGRYLSAINSFRLASEELAKAHMITQAAVYAPSNAKGWNWFWKHFGDHREKLRILEYEFHWKGYKDKEEFHRRISLLRQQREDALYIDLDPTSGKFLEAGSMFGTPGDLKEFAENEFQYVLGVIKFFLHGGVPSQETMLEAYKDMREDRGLVE